MKSALKSIYYSSYQLGLIPTNNFVISIIVSSFFLYEEDFFISAVCYWLLLDVDKIDNIIAMIFGLVHTATPHHSNRACPDSHPQTKSNDSAVL